LTDNRSPTTNPFFFQENRIMKNRKTFTAILGLSIASLLLAGVAQGQDGAAPTKPVKPTQNETSKATAKIGEAAPAFELTDLDGKKHTLKSFEGKIVVIEWFNPGCPYCVGVYEKKIVANTIDELKKIDENIVYLAINSTANMPEDAVIKQSGSFLKEHKVEIPVLMDYSGATGHAYGAKTTPHMFVIDDKGVLRYEGAFTDDPRGSKGAEATNYVINTVKQIKAGETVSPDSVKPWGCSVKYAAKN
jgi:peroxiredoxin